MKIKVLLSLALALGIAQATFAQATPKVGTRQANQQERIVAGAQSGQLTPREAGKLEMQQAKIQHDKRAAKADGVVTPRERARLKREQNRASRHIAREKHDGQTRR